MSIPTEAELLPHLKFGVGQSVARKEDPKLLTGRGRYSDDVDLPGQAHAVVLRSPIAHGILRRIDPAPALALPGVLAVYTAADMNRAGYGLTALQATAEESADGSRAVRSAAPDYRDRRTGPVCRRDRWPSWSPTTPACGSGSAQNTSWSGDRTVYCTVVTDPVEAFAG